jgi:diacylglycerol kinase
MMKKATDEANREIEAYKKQRNGLFEDYKKEVRFVFHSCIFALVLLLLFAFGVSKNRVLLFPVFPWLDCCVSSQCISELAHFA